MEGLLLSHYDHVLCAESPCTPGYLWLSPLQLSPCDGISSHLVWNKQNIKNEKMGTIHKSPLPLTTLPILFL